MQIATALKAITQHYPNAKNLFDFEIEAISDTDGIVHWKALTPLSDAEIATYAAAYDAAQAQAASDAAALRTAAVSVLQSVVGVQANAWTAIQVRALVLALLYEHEPRAVNADTSVKPLNQWLK